MSLATLGTESGRVETIEHNVPYQDPISVLNAVSKKDSPALLLESAEIDSKDNLKSLLMTHAALQAECWGNRIDIKALTDNGLSLIPLLEQALRKTVFENHQTDAITVCANELSVEIPARPAQLNEDQRLKACSVFDVLRVISNVLTPIRSNENAVFLGGVFGYDILASYEQLPDVKVGENTCPDYLFYLAETLITFDHQQRTACITGSVFSGESVAQNYFSISQQLDSLKTLLESETLPEYDHNSDSVEGNKEAFGNDIISDKSDAVFKQDVLNLKEHILAGDIFQVVPSRTFSLPCVSAQHAYCELKKQNPSPYMFYLQTTQFCLFGASPESALKYSSTDNQVEVYPIAGTRPRGKNSDGSANPDLDSRLELDLREDKKEKAEHIMLVDLARNDVAKVSQPGTRHVKDLLNVDRYSHVMHLVSRVVGQLRNDLDALHAYQACMNMGTLVGAPKVSAASLIREVEKKRRGSYGGAVGYLNGNGDMDTCIVIRAAFVKNNVAHIQAGAGVVYDSDPQAEADETKAKAKAVIAAISKSNETLLSKANASAGFEEQEE